MYLQSSFALTVAAISGLLVPLDVEAAPLAQSSRIEIEVTETEVGSFNDRYSMFYSEGGEGGESCEEGEEGSESCEEETTEESDGDG